MYKGHAALSQAFNTVAGNFRGSKYLWFSNINISQFVVYIFVVSACTAGKGSKVTSFVGKIFVVECSTTKTTNILPHENYPLYGSVHAQYHAQQSPCMS